MFNLFVFFCYNLKNLLFVLQLAHH